MPPRTPPPARPRSQPKAPPSKRSSSPSNPSKLSLPAPGVAARRDPGALGALLLISLFTTECGDTDTWWHLKTGQYIVQQHKLPVPDPFAWTTYMWKPAYPGEETTRYFNLTHEWLSQVLLYAILRRGRIHRPDSAAGALADRLLRYRRPDRIPAHGQFLRRAGRRRSPPSTCCGISSPTVRNTSPTCFWR